MFPLGRVLHPYIGTPQFTAHGSPESEPKCRCVQWLFCTVQSAHTASHGQASTAQSSSDPLCFWLSTIFWSVCENLSTIAKMFLCCPLLSYTTAYKGVCDSQNWVLNKTLPTYQGDIHVNEMHLDL